MFKGRKIAKTLAGILTALTVGVFSAEGYYSSKLPSVIKLAPSSEARFAGYPELSCSESRDGDVMAAGAFAGERRATFRLFGVIPVKTVTVREEEPPRLIAGGVPFGAKLLMDGVMVTELGDVGLASGESVCPAKKAGVEVGDVVKTAAGRPILSNAALQEIVAESGGRPVKLTVLRGGEEFETEVVPALSASSGEWKAGMWVRDSIAGIGTMTFINKATGEFAGLGHPICDSSAGELVPLYSGEAVPVGITGVRKGEKGVPGELRGIFLSGRSLGSLYRNSGCGAFGRLDPEAAEELCSSGEEFVLGYRQEITVGEAEIFCTLEGTSPRRYSIEIERVDVSDDDSPKDMEIRVTDPALLEKTGGVVQGMSGSPIIQNGKLVGAVTHVFVSDSARGYGIFAESMAEYLEG